LSLHHGLRGHWRRHCRLLGGAAARLKQRGAGLLQASASFVVGQAQQQVAGLHAITFAHAHLQHRGSDFGANVHARWRIEPPGRDHRLHNACAHYGRDLNLRAAPADQCHGSGHGQHEQRSHAPFDKWFHGASVADQRLTLVFWKSHLGLLALPH